jgi:hypothetical protein
MSTIVPSTASPAVLLNTGSWLSEIEIRKTAAPSTLATRMAVISKTKDKCQQDVEVRGPCTAMGM